MVPLPHTNTHTGSTLSSKTRSCRQEEGVANEDFINTKFDRSVLAMFAIKLVLNCLGIGGLFDISEMFHNQPTLYERSSVFESLSFYPYRDMITLPNPPLWHNILCCYSPHRSTP